MMRPSAPARRSRAFRPVCGGLEPRELPATTVSKLIATPSILTPPNNRFVKVDVTGFVVESNKKVTPTAQYHLVDEYRRYEGQGRVKLTRIGPGGYSFAFSVIVQARRAQEDIAGRQYFVIVGSQDSQNAGGLVVGVLVPHDKVRPGQTVKTSSVSHMKPHHAR